mgnify:CR=1 FL=1
MIYLMLFLEFLKIGLFTLGGGYAMIPLVQETITKHNWLTESQFAYMIGLCEVTPGPIALNMATFVGATNGGFLGGLVATLGVVIPSFIIICIVAALLNHFAENRYIKAALKGTICVAIGLLLSITVTMTLKTITNFGTGETLAFDWQTVKILGFVILGYILMWLTRNKKPTPIPTIAMSIFVGLSVNLGMIPTIITFIVLELLFLISRKKS